MGILAIMLFTRQVSSLQCLFFDSLWYLRLLLFWIKSQPGADYESVAYKKACNCVLWSSKHEEITFPCEFIFLFILFFIGLILPKGCCRKSGVRKKDIKVGNGHIGGCLYKQGVQTFYTICRIQLNIYCGAFLRN